MKAQQNMISSVRRIFTARATGLAALGLAGLLAGCALFHPPPFKGVAGVQLYSVRAQLDKDVPGTLAEVRNWGVRFVELAGTYGLPPKVFKEKLDAAGLDPVSGHFSFEEWSKDPAAVLNEATDLGLVYVGCAWIPHNDPFDEAACRKAIDVFNRAGDLAARRHMHFFYHTHGYEFQPSGKGTLFDLLVQRTNPENVKFEMDIFWIVHAGQDPVKLLGEYPGRWELLHVKDMRKGTPTGLLTGHSDVTNDVAMGTGMLDLPAILRAAQNVGVKWYFIEDESPDSEQQIPESLRYLDTLRN
ncbi:MAG: sugar phosphate isomerase/epimerase [Verrucomicrobiota bacterium]|jgi:sugar phosphate isomerase/epimerase